MRKLWELLWKRLLANQERWLWNLQDLCKVGSAYGQPQAPTGIGAMPNLGPELALLLWLRSLRRAS